MKTKFFMTIALLTVMFGMPVQSAEVNTQTIPQVQSAVNNLDAQTVQGQNAQAQKPVVKKTKQQIAEEKRMEIRKQIIDKEGELRTIKKSAAIRASEKRPIIKNLEEEIQELNAEYAKIK